MLYICAFEFLYSFWDLLVEPHIHSHHGAFVVFRHNEDVHFDREKSFLLIVTYCGCFGFFMAIFGVHFLYRYGAINRSFGDRYLSGRKVVILLIIPLWYGVWWGMLVHSHHGAFVVFRHIKDDYFDREKSFLLIVTYCGCFGFSMAIFGVHFIYRYGAINRNFGDRYLSGHKVVVLLIIPLWYGVWWGMVCYFYFDFDDYCDQYMKYTINEDYKMNVKETSYICVLFYRPNQDGVEAPAFRIFGAIGCCCFMIISSMSCVFYFGFKCYFEISKTLTISDVTSQETKNLQKQLFYALVVETIIPLVLMYIPIWILFIFPMFKLELFFKTNFVAYTIALYPAIDPLPNLIIIKCYRQAIFDRMTKFKCAKKINVSETITM